MKSTVKHYAPVALLMAALVLLGAVLTALCGRTGRATREVTVVTTAYPLYLAATAVAGDSHGVAVRNLTGNAAGCMHDHQLTPPQRILLDEADVVLLNRAEAEPAVTALTGLTATATVVDTYTGHILTGDGVPHEHGHEPHDHANEHVWMNPAEYAAQVAAVTDALCAAHPAGAAQYRANAEAYRRQVLAFDAQLRAAATPLKGRVCVTFHDSVAYFAEALGLTVAASLSVGEDSGVSAGDLATVQQVLTRHPDALLLYDSQYAVRYTAVDKLVPASQVLALDTAVAGDRVGNDWLDAMARNLTLLTEG